MAARNRPAVGQRLRAFPCAGDVRFFQSFSNQARPLLTALFLLVQQRAHRRMGNINIQAHNVDLVIFPERGDFHAGNERQGQSGAVNFGLSCGDGRRGVVIGNSQRANAHRHRAMHQFFRSKQSV